jgi:hypothetical protein
MMITCLMELNGVRNTEHNFITSCSRIIVFLTKECEVDYNIGTGAARLGGLQGCSPPRNFEKN